MFAILKILCNIMLHTLRLTTVHPLITKDTGRIKPCHFCGNKKNFKRIKILERVHKPKQLKGKANRKHLPKKAIYCENSDRFVILKLLILCA